MKSVKKKAPAPAPGKPKTTAKSAKKEVVAKVQPKTSPAKATAKKATVKPVKAAAANGKAPKKEAVAKNEKAIETKVTKKPETKVKSAKPAKAPAVVAPPKAAPVEAKVKPAKQAPPAPVAKAKPAPAKVKQAKPPAVEHIPQEPPTNPEVVEKLRNLQEHRERSKDLARTPDSRASLVHNSPAANQPPEPGKDRLVLMVRDPYWLHASWDVSRRTVQRAKAALAGQWHTVKAILRLMEIDDSGTTANSESIVRDIEIHSGVRNWYIAVSNPPTTFVAAVGYMCSNGRFHELCRSNKVTTPIPGSNDAVDDHWADIAKDAERIFGLSGGFDEESHPDDMRSMFEERLNRPMTGPTTAEYGTGADGSLRRMRDFHFELDVEMVIFGSTQPNAKLIVGSEPVTVRPDGTFSTRVPMPNTRQVIPVTSRARDGSDEQTIVIAVERNTKVMEPVSNNEAED